MKPAVMCAAVILCSLPLAAAEDWPHWRGPTGMGHSSAKGLPLAWGPKENVLWKSPLLATDEKVRLDNNQSSPIVKDGMVFVTMSYWPTSDIKKFPEHHVIAFGAADGKRLWDTKVEPGPWLLGDLRGGYTASTPAADAEHVYALFGSAVLAAIDRKGNVVWRQEVKPYSFDVAMGTSPVLYKDTVLVICEMTNKASKLLAFDRATGDIKWSADRKGAEWTHSTPVIAKVDGKDQLFVAGAYALEGLDPSTGEKLWFAGPGKRERIGDAPTPAFGAGLVYIDSGRGGTGIAVDPTGAGDVSKTHVKWLNKNVPGDSLGSALFVGEYLYRLVTPGVLKCYKLPAGDLVYSERLADATHQSSPVATADGRIYFATGNKSYVVAAGPKFEILGTSALGDANVSSPAIANDRLFLRGQKNLWCVGMAP